MEKKYDLKALGAKTEYKFAYDPTLLEAFPNAHPDNDYFIKFNCPEFTSLCPMTNQPDYAAIYINYIADKSCIESKSLKLYLNSFRNHGEFHENCINTIMKDIVKLISPRYIEVKGKFLPRGGISIDPYANYGRSDKYKKMAEYRLLNHDLRFEDVNNR